MVIFNSFLYVYHHLVDLSLILTWSTCHHQAPTCPVRCSFARWSVKKDIAGFKMGVLINSCGGCTTYIYNHIHTYTYIHIYYIHLYATYIYMLYTSILYTPYYILYSLTNHRKLLQIISGEHEVCVVHWPCSDRPYSDGKVIRNHQSWPMECGGDSPFCGHQSFS